MALLHAERESRGSRIKPEGEESRSFDELYAVVCNNLVERLHPEIVLAASGLLPKVVMINLYRKLKTKIM